MTNVSRLDRLVWDRHFRQWEALAGQKLATTFATASLLDRATSATRSTTVRIGQDFFRNAVLAAYDTQCCITKMRATSLLRAGHIIPWSVSEARRLDPSNGLCLNALHDAAFDAGLIGIDETLCVRVSGSLAALMPEAVAAENFLQYEGVRISLPQRFTPDAECLRYHLENIFVM